MRILSQDTQVEDPVSLEELDNLTTSSSNAPLFRDVVLRKLVTGDSRGTILRIINNPLNNRVVAGATAFNNILMEDTAEFNTLFREGKIDAKAYISTLRFLAHEMLEMSRKAAWIETRRRGICQAINQMSDLWTTVFNKIRAEIRVQLAETQIKQARQAFDTPETEVTEIAACMTTMETIGTSSDILGVLPSFEPTDFVRGICYIRGNIKGYVQIMHTDDIDDQIGAPDAARPVLPWRIYLVVFIKFDNIVYNTLQRNIRSALPGQIEEVASKALKRLSMNNTIMTHNSMRYVRKIKQCAKEEAAIGYLESHTNAVKSAVDAICDLLRSKIDDDSIDTSNMVSTQQVHNRINDMSTNQILEIIENNVRQTTIDEEHEESILETITDTIGGVG